MKLGIVGNVKKPELPRIVRDLLQGHRHRGVEFLVLDTLAKSVEHAYGKAGLGGSKIVSEKRLLGQADIVVALGGDGTILQTARLIGAHEIPILGVNLGKLGFLAEVAPDELDHCLAEVMDGKYRVEERMMLQAVGERLAKSFVGLNDIVVDKHGTSRVMSIETYVNDEYLATYAADGIIVSTPTGSTAYALANGGPILAPMSQAITLSPICPHTLTARPVIVPDNSVVTIRVPVTGQKVHITADGQQEQLFAPPVTIKIKKAPFKARLVKRLDTSYYDVLRKKLNWGSDVRVASRK